MNSFSQKLRVAENVALVTDHAVLSSWHAMQCGRHAALSAWYFLKSFQTAAPSLLSIGGAIAVTYGGFIILKSV